MSQRTAVAARTRSHHRRPWTTAGIVLLLDLALVGALLLLDRVQVGSQQALDGVGLGLPLTWITQAQTISPPLPWQARFLSPWEHPTSVALLPLLADLAICGTVLLTGWMLIRAARARRSR